MPTAAAAQGASKSAPTPIIAASISPVLAEDTNEDFTVEETTTRELVHHAIDTADITPILRLMFNANSANSGKLEAGRKVANVLHQSLLQYAEEQEKVIRDVCHSHALEIAQFVAEISSLRDSVAELQVEVEGSMDGVQQAGGKLVETWKSLNELLASQKNVTMARKVLRSARDVLGSCLEVGQLIEQHSLHQALCLLDTVRMERLPSCFQLLKPTAQQPNAGGQPPGGWDGAAAAGGVAASVQGFFEGLVEDLSTTVEAMAIADFHNWLVAVRADARNIGMNAIKQAAQERALDEQFAQERKAVLSHLAAHGPIQEAASQLVSNAPFRQQLLAELRAQMAQPSGAQPGTSTPASSPKRSTSRSRSRQASRAPLLPPDDPASVALLPESTADAIAALLRQRQQSGASAGVSGSDGLAPPSSGNPAVMNGLDMRGLHRCVHIHVKLGKLPAFQQRYQEQRQLQVATDLQPPANFLESYQAYLAQLVGFFVVEDGVQRLTEGLVTQKMVHGLWENAIGTVAGVLDRALESMGSAAVMLMVKDFAVQLCTALMHCSYNVAALQEVLLESRQHYHSLLTSSIEGQVNAVLEADVLLDYEVRTAQAHSDLHGALGLPSCLEGQKSQGVPYVAPYTSSAPAVLRIVRGFISESLSYLRGLFSPWELAPAVFQHRDRMVSKVVVDALMAKVAVVNSSEFLRETMKMVANVWALTQTLDALDAWTLQQSSGEAEASRSSKPGTAAAAGSSLSPSGSRGRRHRSHVPGDSNTSSVQASLRAVQDTAERNMLRLIADRTQAIMAAARTFNWLPTTPLPQATSPHVQQLLAFLQETFDMAQRLLPRSSYTLLARTVMKSVAAMVMKLFGPEGVKGFNLFALQRLASDVAAMQRFAAKCGVADLEAVFAEQSQLCALLLSDSIEEILVPEVRKQKYGALELAVVATVLDKYREVLSYDRPPKPTNFVKKRAVEAVAKQLRTQMLNGAALRSTYTDDD